MTNRRRNKAEIIRDRRVIADMYLQGKTQADIADVLRVSQATISRDLRALHGEWLQSALIDINEAKSLELAKVDRLEREYWQAWERSCEDAETETRKAYGKIKQVPGEDGAFVQERPVDVVKQSREQIGNPAFLRGIQWCIEQRCKILGVEAPKAVDVTSGGKPIRMLVGGIDLANGI